MHRSAALAEVVCLHNHRPMEPGYTLACVAAVLFEPIGWCYCSTGKLHVAMLCLQLQYLLCVACVAHTLKLPPSLPPSCSSPVASLRNQQSGFDTKPVFQEP